MTPEDASHEVTFSPSGRFFLDNYSKPDVPPLGVLRDAQGKLLATLERADISKLEATGWKPPEPFTVKARDGATDLYGLLFKPTNLDRGKKYPIVNHIIRDHRAEASACTAGPLRCRTGTRRRWPNWDSSWS